MFINYLKTALRFMMRQKGYTAINILGLSLGMASSLLILIYIADEWRYDRFHQHADRIYRVGFSGKLEGNSFIGPFTPAPLAPAMREEFPEVEDVVRFGVWRTMPMAYEENRFTEAIMLVADTNFFAFFSFPMIEGDPATALQGPDKVVLTASAAKRYFGDEPALGKILLRGSDQVACAVTGVVADPPLQSHIQFDMVLSGDSWPYMKDNQWTSNNLFTYYRLRPQASGDDVPAKLEGLITTHMAAELEKFLGISFDQFLGAGNDVGFFIQPLLDIHLHSNFADEITPNGNIQYLYIFGAIALFIILIASINFMNLATARSANRAKEVGVRKTVGAVRGVLIGQFMAEAMLYSVMAGVVAFFLLAMALPAFNFLAGKSLDFSFLSNPAVVAGCILFALLIGLLAGSYPAFYLTSFQPAQGLKKQVKTGYGSFRLRNALVIVQFVISISLMAGSLIIYRQLQYLQEKSLGFQKENVVNLLHTMSLGENAQAFKNAVTSRPEFSAASFANRLPPNIGNSSAFRKEGTEQDFLLNAYQGDHDHLKAMGFEMAMGRFFSRDFRSDTAAVILNETAFSHMGYDTLNGQHLLSYESIPPVPYEIIGVVKDFHFTTLRTKVRPIAIFLSPEPDYEMAIRLTEGNTAEKIALLESIFRQFAPDAPFEYTFVDENFDALFRAERRMSTIILTFTVLAIGIACLGLFGLAAFTAEQRTKEIGIRKVLGASVPQVMVLLSREFTLLVGVAFVIAVPLSAYLMNQWLAGFAYQTEVSPLIWLLAGAVAFVVALGTISFQALKAATGNPVSALRSD